MRAEGFERISAVLFRKTKLKRGWSTSAVFSCKWEGDQVTPELLNEIIRSVEALNPVKVTQKDIKKVKKKEEMIIDMKQPIEKIVDDDPTIIDGKIVFDEEVEL